MNEGNGGRTHHSREQHVRGALRRGWSRRHLLGRGGAFVGVGGVGGGLLAACTPGADTAGQPSRQAIHGTLEIWGVTRFPFDKEIGGEIAREVEASAPGLSVRYTAADDDSTEKVRVAAAGGEPPDLESPNGLTIQTLGADGIAAPLESLLKTSRVIKKDDLWPAFVREDSWRGVLCGMAYGPDVRVLYVNDDQYRRAGLDINKPPQTWDELQAAIGKTLVRDADAIKVLGFDPFIGSGIGNLWTVPFWQLGGELLSSDGTKVTIANDKGLKAWEWLKQVIDQQGGPAALKAFKTGQDPNQLFADGKMSHYYATNAERSESLHRIAPDLRFGFGTYPLPPGGRRVTFGGVHTFVIPRGAKQPDGAWLFLEHLLSEQNNARFADFYDRVPVRRSAAHSEAYLKHDPFRKLVADDMAGRRWLIPAPGAWDMRSDVLGVTADIVDKGVGIQDALTKAQTAIQQKLDKALSAAK